MELYGRFFNYFLASPTRIWEKIPSLTSSWYTSSRSIQFENHPKCSLVEYPLSQLNCLSHWEYPRGRSWRAAVRRTRINLFSILEITVGCPIGIVAGVMETDVLWGTVGMWGVVRMEDEGWFSLEVVGDNYVETECLMVVEFNMANS